MVRESCLWVSTANPESAFIYTIFQHHLSSVQFSPSVVSDSLQPHFCHKCGVIWISEVIVISPCNLFFSFFKNFILFLNFTKLYYVCQISKCIRHRYTCVPHPDPSFLLPPHTIPLGCPNALAPSIQYRASNLDWQLDSSLCFIQPRILHDVLCI